MNKNPKIVAGVFAFHLFISGCASSGDLGTSPNVSTSGSGIDDATGRCLASAATGAVVGGLIGLAIGGGVKNIAIGAGSGAAVGGVGCAVLAALDARDRERIRDAQIQAAASNRPVVLNYNGTDGHTRRIVVKPKMATGPSIATQNRICRPIDGEATIEGTGSIVLQPQRVCRTPSGDWVPA